MADDLKALQAELGANKVQMASLQNRFRDMLDCSKTSLTCIVELSDIAAEEVNSLKAKIDADTKEALISRNLNGAEPVKFGCTMQIRVDREKSNPLENSSDLLKSKSGPCSCKSKVISGCCVESRHILIAVMLQKKKSVHNARKNVKLLRTISKSGQQYWLQVTLRRSFSPQKYK